MDICFFFWKLKLRRSIWRIMYSYIIKLRAFNFTAEIVEAGINMFAALNF